MALTCIKHAQPSLQFAALKSATSAASYWELHQLVVLMLVPPEAKQGENESVARAGEVIVALLFYMGLFV